MFVSKSGNRLFSAQPFDGEDFVVGNKIRFLFRERGDGGSPVVDDFWFAVRILNVLNRTKALTECCLQTSFFEQFSHRRLWRGFAWVKFPFWQRNIPVLGAIDNEYLKFVLYDSPRNNPRSDYKVPVFGHLAFPFESRAA